MAKNNKDEGFLSSNTVIYVLLGLLVVGAYFLGVYKTKYESMSGDGTAQVQEKKNSPAPEGKKTELSDSDWQKLQENPAEAIGDPEAPVMMVEFTDYQCPFCKRYFEQTYSKVKSEYVDSGQVYYIIRDLPLSIHDNAEAAAAAARCAGQEGEYVAMHDMLFANQSEWEGLSDPTETFVQYGREIGVETASCLESQEVQQAVQDDLQLARSVGATGTPTFFINGQVLVGAQPFSSFQDVIEGQLE